MCDLYVLFSFSSEDQPHNTISAPTVPVPPPESLHQLSKQVPSQNAEEVRTKELLQKVINLKKD